MRSLSTEELFSDALGRALAENRTSVRRLEALSGVSRRTVENWLHGPVRRPRHWEPVLRVASALHLSAADTDHLLQAAGLPRLDELRASFPTQGQAELLVMWHAPPGKAGDGNAPVNLPVASSWFVGREAHLERLTLLLLRPEIRLVTVTGLGGIGKTRLALEAAARVANVFLHGVFFIPLETATTGGELALRLLNSLGIRRRSDIPPEKIILEYLRDKHVLLILDTLEHLLPELELIGRIHQSAPQVHLLATSRSVLRLSGELVFTVPPLDVTAAAADSHADAVALFVSRVREMRPDFTLTEDNAADVSRVCRLLGGLPLAIELAAAQIRVLSLHRLLARLERGTDLLAGGPRDAPIRHQSIEQTLSWSYNLLSEAEQTLFRCLGIFEEGSSLAAIGAVAPPQMCEGDRFIDILTGLVDKSMLQALRLRNRRSYRMHEITRHFAVERLVVAGETDTVMHRLLDFMLDLAEQVNRDFRSPDRNRRLEIFEPESTHIWPVLQWGVASDDTAVIEKCLALTGAMLQYWNTFGLHEPARKWTDRALAAARHHDIPLPAQGMALITAASLALIQTEVGEGETHATAALAAARAGGDRRLEIRALHLLGLCAYSRSDLDAAAEIWEEALRQVEGENAPSLLAAALDDLGNLAARRGEFDRALIIHRREQAVSLAAGDLYSEFYAVINLGEVSVNMGRPEAAELYYRRALELCRAMGDSRGLAHITLTRARLMLQLGRPEESRRLVHEAAYLAWDIQNLDIVLQALVMMLDNASDTMSLPARARLGGALSALNEQYASASLPVDQEAIAGTRQQLSRLMDIADIELEWQVGRRLSWEQAVDLAFETGTAA